jgi:hypothetical protein
MEPWQSQQTIGGSKGDQRTLEPPAMLCLMRYMRLSLEQSRCNLGGEWNLVGRVTERMSFAVGLREVAVDL